MKINKINAYIFIQIFKYFLLILFIFLSVAWILQITRLLTVTNFMYISSIEILFLSFFLIPNIITVIMPFILIFGLLLCFLKMNKDNEFIAVLSLGLGLRPFKTAIFIFSITIVFLFIILNFYLAPKVYEIYKLKEYDLRNTINFKNMAFSNFINLDNSTILDFKKNNNDYEDIFISFNDGKENIIFAKKGNIFLENNQYNFQLIDGFKISLDNKEQIEKLEFLNYILKIDNKEINNETNIDKNTFTIFDDLISKNYLNISYKILDIIIIIFIIFFFYNNNIKRINFNSKNNIYYSSICIIILLINQILKNSEIIYINYILIMISLIIFLFSMTLLKKKYEQN